MMETLETRRLLDAAAPTVLSVHLNSDRTDPPDLPSRPQPTTWSVQRSQWSSVSVEFSEDVSATADDVRLVRLDDDGVAHPIAVSAEQVASDGRRLSIDLTDHALDDGVYGLEIASTVADLDGIPLDGNQDGMGGDPYVLIGNPDNRFFSLRGDFNGDGGVSLFDYAALGYWFGRAVPPAPSYVDLDGDEGVGILDIGSWSDNMGRGISFPAQQPPSAADDRIDVTENETRQVFVLHNDVDPNADRLFVSSVDDSALSGVVTIADDARSVTYDPGSAWDLLSAGETATERFSYVVSDGNGGTGSAEVTVLVEGTDDPPRATADEILIGEDDGVHLLTGALLANDEDVDRRDEIMIHAVNAAETIGTVRLDDGLVSYAPSESWQSLRAGETAIDRFFYTITDGRGISSASVQVTIRGENEPPTVDRLTSSPSTIAAGDIMTLVPVGVDDPDGAVTSVSFYRDANRNGIVDADERSQPVAIVDSSSPTFDVTISTESLVPGMHSFVVEVTDDQGASSSAATDVRIDPPDDVWIERFASNGRDWLVDIDGEWSTRQRIPLRVGVYASSDGSVLDRLLGHGWIDPEQELRLTISPAFDDRLEDYFLVAVADDDGSLGETDESNNSLAFQGGVFRSADGTVHIHGGALADVADISMSRTLDVALITRWMVDLDNDLEASADDLELIESFLVERESTPWRNPHNPWDVNDDGTVNASDAVVLINYINAHGTHDLEPPSSPGEPPPPYLDVNGDNSVNALDYVRIVNLLNAVSKGWWNDGNPLDADGDGRITEHDADLVRRHLDRPLPGVPLEIPLEAPAEGTVPDLFLDVNGDNLLSKLDADLVAARLAHPLLQNPDNAFDVNDSGEFSPIDSLILKDHLREHGEYLASLEPAGESIFADVNGDGFVSHADVDWLLAELDVLGDLENPDDQRPPWHNVTNPFDVNGDMQVTDDDLWSVQEALNVEIHRFAREQVAAVHVRLHGDDDVSRTSSDVSLTGEVDVPLIVFGGTGSDQLQGGNADDMLRGGPGNDHAVGQGGADTLWGDDGADRLHGSDGDDTLVGGDGGDRLHGEGGADRMIAESTSDRLYDGMRDALTIRGLNAPLVTRGFDGKTALVDLAASLDEAGISPGGVTFTVGEADHAIVMTEIDIETGRLSLTPLTDFGETVVQIRATHPDAVDPLGNPGGIVFVFEIKLGFASGPVASIVNGGFEMPALTENGWDIFAEEQVPGWSILSGPTEPGPFLEFHRGLFGGPAQGSQYVELDGDQNGPDGDPVSGERGSVTIGQVVSTVPGDTYELSFDFAPRPGTDSGDNALSVVVSDLSQGSEEVLVEELLLADGTGDQQINWRTYTLVFTPPGEETLVRFSDRGDDDTAGTFLDNVWIDRPAVDLDMDSDNDGQITRVDDYLETLSPGGRVVLNGPLAELRLDTWRVEGPGRPASWVILETLGSSGAVRFWEDPDRQVALGSSPLRWPSTEVPRTLWMEGLSPGSVELRLSLTDDVDSGPRPITSDVVRVSVDAATDEDTVASFLLGDDFASVETDLSSHLSRLGASVVITDGGYVIYDPTQSGQLQSLRDGESVADSFAYRTVDDESAEVRVLVSGADDSPRIRALHEYVIAENDVLSLPVLVQDQDDPWQNLAFEMLDAPPTARFENGYFVWEPGDDDLPGEYGVTIRVTDADGNAALESFAVTLLPPGSVDPPVVATILDQFAYEGETLEVTIQASTDDGRALTYEFVSGVDLPGDAYLDAHTGVLRWTPDELAGGKEFRVPVRARSSQPYSVSSTMAFTIRVREVDDPPTIAPIGPQSASIGFPFVLSVNATDGDVPPRHLTYRLAEGAPEGLSISPGGTLFWIPTSETPIGPQSVTVHVSEIALVPQTASTTFTIDVRPPLPPMTTGIDVDPEQVERGGQVELSATFEAGPETSVDSVRFYQDLDGDGFFGLDDDRLLGLATDVEGSRHALTVSSSDLPAGDHAIYALARDGFGQYALSHLAVLTVMDDDSHANRPPYLTEAITDQRLDEGEMLEIVLRAADPDGLPLAYGLLSSPEDATLSADGVLRWPTDESDGPSRVEFLVRISDTGTPPSSLIVPVVVDVNEVNLPPQMEPVPRQVTTEHSPWTVTVNATDSDVPAGTVRFMLVGDSPPGMSLDSHSGQVRWTPDELQGGLVHVVTVRAEDELGLGVERSFELEVQEHNQPPELQPTVLLNGYVDQQLDYVLQARDPDAPAQPLMFSLEQVPDSMADASIDPATGRFLWTPDFDDLQATHSLVVQVRDSRGAIDQRVLSVFVHASSVAPTLTDFADVRVDENELVEFSAGVVEPVEVVGEVRYELVDPPPALELATIDPTTGRFLWQTDESHGGGTYDVTIRASNERGQNDDRVVSIKVDDTNQPPSLAAPDDLVARVNRLLALGATARDDDLPRQQLSYQLFTSRVVSAAIDPTTGVLDWTPTLDDLGQHEFTIVVADEDGATDQATFTVQVTEGDDQEAEGQPIRLELFYLRRYENDQGIVPLNLGWHEQGLAGGTRVADHEHEGMRQLDPEIRIASVLMRNLNPEPLSGVWRLKVAEGNPRDVRLYDTALKEIVFHDGVSKSMPIVVPADTLSLESFFIEGVKTTPNLKLVAEFLPDSSRIPPSSHGVNLHVLGADLQFQSLAEADEDVVGALLPENRDHDQGYTLPGPPFPLPLPDDEELFLPTDMLINVADDELGRARIVLRNTPGWQGRWKLSFPENLRVWDAQTRQPITSDALSQPVPMDGRTIDLFLSGVNVSEQVSQLKLEVLPVDAQGQPIAPTDNVLSDSVSLSVIRNDLQILPLDELEEDRVTAVLAVNDDHDEGNWEQHLNHPVSDVELLTEPMPEGANPAFRYARLGIAPEDSDLAVGHLELAGPAGATGRWWIEIVDRFTGAVPRDAPLRVWVYLHDKLVQAPTTRATAFKYTLDSLGIERGLFLEGLTEGQVTLTGRFELDGTVAASATDVDSRDHVDVDVIDLDIKIDQVDEWEEENGGAWIVANQDFSKGMLDDERVPIPDHHVMPTPSGRPLFDPEFERDMTTAEVHFGRGKVTGFYTLAFSDDVLVWDVTYPGPPALVRSGEENFVSPASESLKLLIEGLSSNSSADEHLELEFVPHSLSHVAVSDLNDRAEYHVVELNLAADGNRDGSIDYEDKDDTRLTFWYNNDREGELPGSKGVAVDFLGFGANDSRDPVLDSARDLEDLAPFRVHVDEQLIRAGTIFRFGMSDALDDTRLNVFRHYATSDVADPRSHVSDLETSRSQVRLEEFQEAVVSIGAGMLRDSMSRGTLKAGDNGLLLEFGCSAKRCGPEDVRVTLRAVVPMLLRDKFLSRDVQLKLFDFSQFYDVFQVESMGGERPEAGSTETTPLSPFEGYELKPTRDRMGNTHVNDLPTFDGKDYLLYVHGWNVTSESKIKQAETAFKRLYWQGFQGRFGMIDWPNYADTDGPLDGVLAPANTTYNPSDLNAYRSGEATTKLLFDLNNSASWSRYSGNVHVVAHSQGNVVVSEALRKWRTDYGNAPALRTYVAVSAAVAGGAYGSDESDIAPATIAGDIDYFRSWPQGRVPFRIGDQPFYGSTRSTVDYWVNLHLPIDSALDAWRLNNLAKNYLGLLSLPNGGTLWPFRYLKRNDGSLVRMSIDPDWTLRTTTVTIGEFTFPVTLPSPNGPGSILRELELLDTLGNPGADIHEILAFIAVSVSGPLGKNLAPGPLIQARWTQHDINYLGLNGLPGSTGFANHSFPFFYTAAENASFWRLVHSRIAS